MKPYAPVVCSFLVACSSAQSPQNSLRIYGGTKVKDGAWMNTVAITDKDGMYCSGTALTPQPVVTAAHCVEGEKVSEMRVYVGSGAKGGDVKGQYEVAEANYSPLYDGNDDGRPARPFEAC